MSQAVLITFLEFSSHDLRERAKLMKTSLACRRLLALALCLEGVLRSKISVQCGLNRQALCDLVNRYNKTGLLAIHNQYHRVQNSRLTADQTAKLCLIIEAGADFERDGVVRYRRIDLVKVIEREFGITYAERSVGHILKRLGFSHISARPKHPNGDEAAREAFKKTLQAI
jgi:transposase